jgi:hypothetical protein
MTSSRHAPFRRGRLAMVFSSLAASSCCYAKNPLIPAVQISGTTTKNDHIVLAGASLGAMTNKLSEWGKTFRDHP